MTDSASDVPAPGFRPDQLEGFRIGVTSDRRSEDLISAFERRGAEVIHAPTIRIAGAEDDDKLASDTAAVIATPPDILLATTSYGVRRWFESADAAGLGPALTASLEGTRILVRGPKARGAIRATGLDDAGMSDEETTKSLVDRVLSGGVEGRTVAVQLHGFTDRTQLERLEAAGARVLTVAPYRWLLPEDSTRVVKLIDAICTGSVDAVTFTSAPAVEALFEAANEVGRLEQMFAAFSGPNRSLASPSGTVVAAAVGHVTAAPLVAAGIQPLVPERYRMGALIRQLCEYLETERVHRLDTRHGAVELRGRLVRVNGEQATLPPLSLTLFRLLMRASGSVLSRTELMAAVPETQDDHAVDVAMSRLRQALPLPALVATVIKRGYRLDV